MSRFIPFAATIAVLALATAAHATEKVVLQLSGPPEFEYAGYYAALWQGYYRDAGLDVVIEPGVGTAGKPVDPVREVTEGRAQFGTGTADLVVRAGQGLPLSLLAPIFQGSGAMIYYRADRDLAAKGALAGAKIGRLPAGDGLEIEAASGLKADGLDPAKLDTIAIDPGQTVAALADRKVDAAPGSAWEAPFLASERGVSLKALDLADHRVPFYGDTLFALRRLVETEPQTVSAFRAASLKGWEYALQHPDPVIKRMVAELPHPPGVKDAAAFDHYQAGVAKRLARWPEVSLGDSNPKRWARIEASIAGAGALLQTAGSGQFVYQPEAANGNGGDSRLWAGLGAALILALAALTWLRRRRRPIARPETAATAPQGRTLPAEAEMPTAPQPATAPRRLEPPKVDLPEADLNALLTRLERTLRHRVPGPVAFRLSLLPDLWRCRADVQIVRRLVFDLVKAAATGLKEGGELIVGTRNIAVSEELAAETPGGQPGQYARITVRDNGAGLSEEALSRVFDPQATPRPAAAAAAAAMREAGGFVRVESAEEIGTAVHLYFARLDALGETRPAQAA